jgi:hypothetical protein
MFYFFKNTFQFKTIEVLFKILCFKKYHIKVIPCETFFETLKLHLINFAGKNLFVTFISEIFEHLK